MARAFDRRERLIVCRSVLDAGVDLFGRRGFAKTGIDQIVLSAVGTPTALVLASVGTPAEIPAASVAASGFTAAPTTAVSALLTVSPARTKVQEMTVGKVLGPVLPAPLLLILIPSAWRFAALLVPSGWTAAPVLGVRSRGLCLPGGMLFNGLLLTVVFPWCRRR